MDKRLLYTVLCLVLGQSIIWYQTNSQFIWPWAKKYPLLLSFLGVPVSYLFIHASKHAYRYFGDLIWPGRLLGFALGMLIMATLTYTHLGEGISTKTAISLVLAFIILVIQLY